MIKNYEWIQQKLEGVTDADNFITEFKKISRAQHDSPFAKDKPEISIIRNDFMFDDKKKDFFQIEYNLIAVSLGPIVQRVSSSLSYLNEL